MSRLTVAGPGAVCGAVDENGDPVRLLRAGVQVHEAQLDFGHAAVRDIHNTPMAQCRNTGAGIAVLDLAPGAPSASATIHHAEVTDYGAVGVVAVGAGSWANVTHSRVAGPGHEGGVPTTGINLTRGAVGTIAHNTVSGNICPDGMPQDCGPDFFGAGEDNFTHGMKVAEADLQVPGATYYVEAFYIVRGDSNIFNSMGYRQVAPAKPSLWTFTNAGPYIQGPAINAWDR